MVSAEVFGWFFALVSVRFSAHPPAGVGLQQGRAYKYGQILIIADANEVCLLNMLFASVISLPI